MRCGMLMALLCSFNFFGIGDNRRVMMMERNWMFVLYLTFTGEAYASVFYM